MADTNPLTQLPDDAMPEYSWQTSERAYYLTPKFFVKRSLRLSESPTLPNGDPALPFLGMERLQNEAATLQFLRQTSNIPVPTVYGSLMVDGAYFLIIERIDGVSMDALPEDQKQLVWPEIEQHLATLHNIKSCTLGGPSGVVIPPWRALLNTQDEILPQKRTDTEYVLCHNDLSQYNIMVDSVTLKITAIIDWEYSGFFPPYFEAPFYKRLGASEILDGEPDDVPELLYFLLSPTVTF